MFLVMFFTLTPKLTFDTLLGSNSEGTNKQVTFREPVSNSEIDDQDVVHQAEREPITNWSSGQSPPPATLDEPSSSHSPALPPVLEEPSPSFSEGKYIYSVYVVSMSVIVHIERGSLLAADDDPLPAIEALQISGEAFPGQELQACGYSINGTTSCNFEVHFHELNILSFCNQFLLMLTGILVTTL